MDKRRKKNDFIWLYVVDDGTEELKLRKEELLNRIEASKKSKNEVEELPANREFQQQIISLANQIVEKQYDLDRAINELNMKLKALS